MPPNNLRRRVEQIIEKLIDVLDLLDVNTEDLDDTGDAEPDDTGLADEDALAGMMPAQRHWFEEWPPPMFGA